MSLVSVSKIGIPRQIPGLTSWVELSTPINCNIVNVNQVDFIKDLSMSNNNYRQTGATRRPVYTDNSILSFLGAVQSLTASAGTLIVSDSAINMSQGTSFISFKCPDLPINPTALVGTWNGVDNERFSIGISVIDPSTMRIAFGLGSNAQSGFRGVTNLVTGQTYIAACSWSSSIGRRLYLDGVLENSIGTINGSTPNLRLGLCGFSSTLSPTVGSEVSEALIGEFLYYRRVLTTSEFNTINTYLSNKWGV